MKKKLLLATTCFLSATALAEDIFQILHQNFPFLMGN